MPRKSPAVLLSINKNDTSTTLEILESEKVYSLCYNGELVNVRECTQRNSMKPDHKVYLRTSFHSPGFAYNLAAKLNDMFRTTKFSVTEISKKGDIQ